jgi:hypothetical protein
MLGLFFCLPFWSAGVVPTAMVFLVHILHVTDDLSILVEPRTPGVPGLIGRSGQIVHLPHPLIFFC